MPRAPDRSCTTNLPQFCFGALGATLSADGVMLVQAARTPSLPPCQSVLHFLLWILWLMTHAGLRECIKSDNFLFLCIRHVFTQDILDCFSPKSSDYDVQHNKLAELCQQGMFRRCSQLQSKSSSLLICPGNENDPVYQTWHWSATVERCFA